MVALTDNTALILTVSVEHCDHYKLLWKLSQVIRGHSLQPDIYDDVTILGITWRIIGYGRQYFRQSLILSEFTGNIFKIKIVLSMSTLGLLVRQLHMGMPIRVNRIPEKWRSLYIGKQLQENKYLIYIVSAKRG